jgi:acylphosphatase
VSDLIRHISVRGRVQGVGYRAFVADEATGRGIAGWVRNRRDGSVEAVLSGPAEAVQAMIAACRRGPWGARVDSLDEREAAAQELDERRGGGEFSVLPTL